MAEAITLTKKDLADIITAAVTAAKAPNVIEQATLDADAKRIAEAQRYRAQAASQVIAEKEQKKALQRICNHEHANGDTQATYIQEPRGQGYFICLKNQCKIRPEVPAEQRQDKDAIYDTAEFNRLFQKARTNEIFG